MTSHDARTLALSLMAAHGLGDWSFRFNHRRRTLGLCFYELRQIELSCHFVAHNEEPAIRDTILHEIAHALAGKGSAHGPVWKAICRRIGARPERCDRSATMPKGRWHATCPNCGKHFHRFRRPLRGATYACNTCGPARGPVKFCLDLPARV